jgi:hypothetical protein
MRIRSIFRWDEHGWIWRLFRILWSNDSKKFTIAFSPPIRWYNEGDGWIVWFFCFRFHYRKSSSGRFV